MKNFTGLFTQLDQTTKTLVKIKALINYFERASDKDKLWAIALLSHRRPRRTVNTGLLSLWSAELSRLPDWLFVESRGVVGDLAETITLLLPPPTQSSDDSLSFWINFIKDLDPLSVEEKKKKYFGRGIVLNIPNDLCLTN